MKTLLLTGATGFFGRALLRQMQSNCERDFGKLFVETLSRNPDDFCRQYPDLAALPWLRVCRGDILDRASFSSLSAPDWVLHAAADSTRPGGLTARTRYEQIVDGTRHVLDFASASSSSRFLYVSSGGVYGAQPAELARIPESFLGIPDPLLPGSTYGIAKRAAEHLCAMTGHETEMSVVIARCFAFVGEDLPLNVHFAIGNFIRDALWSDDVIVRGDGLPIRSYMDQRDLASWLFALLERGQSGRAYNVGSDHEISMTALAELVVSVVCPGKAVRVLGGAVGSGGGNRYVPCISRARDELGLSLTISLSEAIQYAAQAARTRGHP
jgi:dTDP-glucose 4,6-dehydratase